MIFQINVHYKDGGDGVFVDAPYNSTIEFVDPLSLSLFLSIFLNYHPTPSRLFV